MRCENQGWFSSTQNNGENVMRKNDSLTKQELDFYTQKISEAGQFYIRRTDLCKICPIFNRNTLRNRDSGLNPIATLKHFNGRAYYETKGVIAYMEKNFFNPNAESEEEDVDVYNLLYRKNLNRMERRM